jgi:hypothetical protein
MTERPSRTHEPQDRLTRLCDAMTKTLEAHPERGDEQVIVFLTSDADQKRGLVLYGFEDDSEAIAELFIHLKAIFEANGKTLVLAPLRSDG